MERYTGIITFGGPAETKRNGAAYAGPRGPQLWPKGHLNFSQSWPRGPATGPRGSTTRPEGPTTGPRVQSWLQSPQLRLTSIPTQRSREQAVPATEQGVIEPGARQSVQGHTQCSRTILPFPLNSRHMKAVYLRRVVYKLGLPIYVYTTCAVWEQTFGMHLSGRINLLLRSEFGILAQGWNMQRYTYRCICS